MTTAISVNSVNFVIVIYRIYSIHNHQMSHNCYITAGSGLSLDMTGLDQIVSDFKSLASTNSATPAQVFARFNNAPSEIGGHHSLPETNINSFL
jgi:hypothetical protein